MRTLLGSCVSITLWHPDLKVGGICHYMLPERTRANTARHDGKYAEEAFMLLLREVEKCGAPLREYEAKLFGGGNMFPRDTRCPKNNVGQRNAEVGKSLLTRHGLTPRAQHVGGAGHRTLIFDISNGDVWVKLSELPAPAACDQCELAGECFPQKQTQFI